MAEMTKQPEVDIQSLLNTVLTAKPEKVTFRNKEYSIGWLHYGTMRKFSDIALSEKHVGKQLAKMAACILLNSRWRLKLFYWCFWRWIYYVLDPSPDVLLGIVDVGKKKLPHLLYMILTIYSTAMRDTIATMTKEERELSQAEQYGADATA